MKRRGFTLIEVLIALVVLSIVILGLASATGGFIRTVAESDRSAAAIQLAQDRIQSIQMNPGASYVSLEARFAGTETNFPTLPGYTRVTTIRLIGGAGQPQNFKRVTVVVSGPGLVTPIARSVTIGAP